MASRSSNPVVSDPDLPALEVLIGEGAEPFLASVLETVGSRLRSYRISQVRYVPSRSVTVQYRADVIAASGKPEDSTFVRMVVSTGRGRRFRRWVTITERRANTNSPVMGRVISAALC